MTLICARSIFCMLLALASIVASLGILAGSDGRNIENWTTPPSTYIALFTAVANLYANCRENISPHSISLAEPQVTAMSKTFRGLQPHLTAHVD